MRGEATESMVLRELVEVVVVGLRRSVCNQCASTIEVKSFGEWRSIECSKEKEEEKRNERNQRRASFHPPKLSSQHSQASFSLSLLYFPVPFVQREREREV